ncbi:MAG: hypothetical protein GX430_12450 [Treponema sp.]|nr:hypothetical protein [Treponema sp.]
MSESRGSAILSLEDSMKTKSRLKFVPAALLALFLASGCVSVPKEPETVPAAQAEADAGSSASADAESGATSSY